MRATRTHSAAKSRLECRKEPSVGHSHPREMSQAAGRARQRDQGVQLRVGRSSGQSITPHSDRTAAECSTRSKSYACKGVEQDVRPEYRYIYVNYVI